MNKFIQTREVISHCLDQIKGVVIDIRGGAAKYRSLMTKIVSYASSADDEDIEGGISNFVDNTFDAVLALEVLEHTARPQAALQEIKRILKPGGVLILTVPFLLSYHARPNDYFRYTKEGLGLMLNDQQFEIIESDIYCPMYSALLQILIGGCFAKKRFVGQDRCLKYAGKLASWLDRHFVKNENIYGGVYAVARKKIASSRHASLAAKGDSSQ
ncbi:MAG: class I SAM-dependent methyltransferase [Patescibacteria group bacterium]